MRAASSKYVFEWLTSPSEWFKMGRLRSGCPQRRRSPCAGANRRRSESAQSFMLLVCRGQAWPPGPMPGRRLENRRFMRGHGRRGDRELANDMDSCVVRMLPLILNSYGMVLTGAASWTALGGGKLKRHDKQKHAAAVERFARTPNLGGRPSRHGRLGHR